MKKYNIYYVTMIIQGILLLIETFINNSDVIITMTVIIVLVTLISIVKTFKSN